MTPRALLFSNLCSRGILPLLRAVHRVVVALPVSDAISLAWQQRIINAEQWVVEKNKAGLDAAIALYRNTEPEIYADVTACFAALEDLAGRIPAAQLTALRHRLWQDPLGPFVLPGEVPGLVEQAVAALDDAGRAAVFSVQDCLDDSPTDSDNTTSVPTNAVLRGLYFDLTLDDFTILMAWACQVTCPVPLPAEAVDLRRLELFQKISHEQRNFLFKTRNTTTPTGA